MKKRCQISSQLALETAEKISRHFQAPNFSETAFFTPSGRKMSVRAADVTKEVKNSPKHFWKHAHDH
jgi:hypothetical protein